MGNKHNVTQTSTNQSEPNRRTIYEQRTNIYRYTLGVYVYEEEMFFNFCPTQTSTLLVVSPPIYFAIPSTLLTGIAHGITPDAHFLYSTPLVGA